MKKWIKIPLIVIALHIIPTLLIYLFCWSSLITCNFKDMMSLYFTGIVIDVVIVGTGWGIVSLFKWRK